MASLLKLNIPPLEIVVIALFVVYLVFPIKSPNAIVPVLNNSIGMAAVLLIALYLFLYTHPILGILSLLVAYELMRRTCKSKVKHVRLEENNEVNKKRAMESYNKPVVRTLEEEIVQTMTPSNDKTDFVVSTYKPVVEDSHSALVLKK
jgi:hypothetical protein